MTLRRHFHSSSSPTRLRASVMLLLMMTTTFLLLLVSSQVADGRLTIADEDYNYNQQLQDKEVDEGDMFIMAKRASVRRTVQKPIWDRCRCTRQRDYWISYHSEGEVDRSWPPGDGTTEMKILCNMTWQEIMLLENPKRRDAWIRLAKEFIAAQLNKLDGACDEVVSDYVSSAHKLLGCCHALPRGAEYRMKALSLTRKLELFNKGVIGPGKCKPWS